MGGRTRCAKEEDMLVNTKEGTDPEWVRITTSGGEKQPDWQAICVGNAKHADLRKRVDQWRTMLSYLPIDAPIPLASALALLYLAREAVERLEATGTPAPDKSSPAEEKTP
jgi:hypothetical protein